ncbi:MAG: protein kinase domain-containing protein [Planctomycetia bacterium]
MADGKHDRDELIGRLISGRYRILSRIGAGGMGVAYRAWDEHAAVPVVVKIPKQTLLQDPLFAERFDREIRLLQGLQHPHIVPILDVGEIGRLPYVAMRFLPGGSLTNRRLRDEHGNVMPNPPGMLHLWLPAVADALDFVHGHGVVHRDVKPANIFFDAQWGAFLGDFGIAKVVEESEAFAREQTLTAAHMGIGTPAYMAPEQFTPRAAIDGRTDQYALAVMAYELLAGAKPFASSGAQLIVDKTVRVAPRLDGPRPDLPRSLVEAVQRALSKSAGERFATCREFSAALLRDMPILHDDPAITRLLCPGCDKILKLPLAAAGQKGKCPNCATRLQVASDLGSLWRLDEARRQKRPVARVQEHELEPALEPELQPELEPEIAVATPDIDEEALESFQPISNTLPLDGPSGRRRPWPAWLLGGGLVAALVTAALIWPQPPEGPPPPQTYEEKLAGAWQRLRTAPTDAAANEFVGRHLCFRETDWAKGLPRLARGRHGNLSELAQSELLARGSASVAPGVLIHIAQRWWTLAAQPGLGATDASAALRKHAGDLYLEHVESLTAPQDIAFANAWLDEDGDFRSLTANKRPAGLVAPPDTITDKTLVVWVKLSNLKQRGGSALTLETLNDTFDAIVFGEVAPKRWLAGSDRGSRLSPQAKALAEEKEDVPRFVCMATVYEGNQVTVYRDGRVYDTYAIKKPVTFSRNDSRVVIGLRHTAAKDKACLAAEIDDARIYAVPLTATEIADLRPNMPSQPRPVAWWTFDDLKPIDVMACFPRTQLRKCHTHAGCLVLKGGKDSFMICEPPTATDANAAPGSTPPGSTTSPSPGYTIPTVSDNLKKSP